MKAVFELYGIKQVADLPDPPPLTWKLIGFSNIAYSPSALEQAIGRLPEDNTVEFRRESVINGVAFYKPV